MLVHHNDWKRLHQCFMLGKMLKSTAFHHVQGKRTAPRWGKGGRAYIWQAFKIRILYLSIGQSWQTMTSFPMHMPGCSAAPTAQPTPTTLDNHHAHAYTGLLETLDQQYGNQKTREALQLFRVRLWMGVREYVRGRVSQGAPAQKLAQGHAAHLSACMPASSSSTRLPVQHDSLT